MPPASTMSETGTDVLFGSGKVAMISQGSWMAVSYTHLTAGEHIPIRNIC